MSVRSQVALSLLFVGLFIAVLMGLNRFYGWSIGAYLEGVFHGNRDKRDVEITMIANLDSKVLRMTFRVYCKNEPQRRETQQKVPRIQHELVNEVNENRMTRALLEHDLASVRKHVLQIVNHVMTESVQSVHLVRFFFD